MKPTNQKKQHMIPDDDFAAFCRRATDSQLRAILEKEFKADRPDDYKDAVLVAAERGWWVHNGEVL